MASSGSEHCIENHRFEDHKNKSHVMVEEPTWLLVAVNTA